MIQTSKADIIWSFLGYFFKYVSNVLIVLLVMSRLDNEELGLWYAFLSVGALVAIFDFGISTTLARNVTYAWNGARTIEREGYSVSGDVREPNYHLLKQIIDSSRQICMIIAVMALIIMLLPGSIYVIRISRGLRLSRVAISWFIYSIAVFFNLYNTFLQTSLIGMGAVKESQIAMTLSKTLQIVISHMGACFGIGVIALSVAYFVFCASYRLIASRFLYSYGDIKTHFMELCGKTDKNETRSIFRTVWFNARKMGLVSLSSYMIKQTTTIVCTLYIGLSETAAYGLCLQVFTAVSGLALVLFQAETPMLVSLKVGGRIDGLKKNLSLCVIFYCLVYSLAILCGATFGIMILKTIKPDLNIQSCMIIFMGIMMFLESNHSMFASYIAMSNEIPFVKSSIISGLCIVILSFSMGALLHSIYILMAVQFIVQLSYNNWRWPVYAMNELKLYPLDMIKLSYVEICDRIKKRNV